MPAKIVVESCARSRQASITSSCIADGGVGGVFGAALDAAADFVDAADGAGACADAVADSGVGVRSGDDEGAAAGAGAGAGAGEVGGTGAGTDDDFSAAACFSASD